MIRNENHIHQLKNPQIINPYVTFHQLVQQKINNQNYKRNIPQKQIDRLTKVDTRYFKEQGQYTVADNMIRMFPHTNIVLGNKHFLTDQFSWIIGLYNISDQIKKKKFQSIKQKFSSEQNFTKFHFQEWKNLIIQIPLIKYPWTDYFKILVPITLFWILSLLLIYQQRGINKDNLSTVGARIANACALIIAYCSMIIIIRSSIPVTTFITLVQAYVMISVIPLFLAIIQAVIDLIYYPTKTREDFQRQYNGFKDGFFFVSFFLCMAGVLILIIRTIVRQSKLTKRKYKYNNFKESKMKRIDSPFYLAYMETISKAYLTKHQIATTNKKQKPEQKPNPK